LKISLHPLAFTWKFFACLSPKSSARSWNRPAQARRVSAQGPLRHGHLRRQGARPAETGDQYFQSSRRNGWDLKFNALVEAICDFDVHVVRSEPEALLLESKLIKEFKPRFNISLRDDKRYLMLKVNLNDPIPNSPSRG